LKKKLLNIGLKEIVKKYSDELTVTELSALCNAIVGDIQFYFAYAIKNRNTKFNREIL
jgi:hypothetical protein